jgi:hypothetical protein
MIHISDASVIQIQAMFCCIKFVFSQESDKIIGEIFCLSADFSEIINMVADILTDLLFVQIKAVCKRGMNSLGVYKNKKFIVPVFFEYL